MTKTLRTSDELKDLKKVPDSFSLEDVFTPIILDIRKSKANGDYPVKLRVTWKRKQHYYPCIDTSIEEWKAHISDKQPHGVLLETTKLTYISFQTIIDITKDLAHGKHFTFGELDMRLNRGTEESILDAFKTKIAQLKKDGRIGTSAWYTCALKSIEKFAKKDVKFADVTPEWLHEYQKHLEKEEKKTTTISINVRALRAIINGGRGKIITEAQYPFRVKVADTDKYQIPKASGRKIALNTPQLMEVFNYPVSPESEKWRDLFVFSFYCNGANINDILHFKYENIVKIGDNKYIEWYRQKTKNLREKTTIKAAIREEMQEIIDKWGNPERKRENYIFPILKHGLSPTEDRMVVQNTIHTINKKMKKIGDALGYDNLTSYVARHSFASISRRLGTKIFAISQSLGHKNLSTTQIYLDSLSDEEIIENAAKLPGRQKLKTNTIITSI